MATNLTQILNCKHNFRKEFERLKFFWSPLTMVDTLMNINDCQHTQKIRYIKVSKCCHTCVSPTKAMVI